MCRFQNVIESIPERDGTTLSNYQIEPDIKGKIEYLWRLAERAKGDLEAHVAMRKSG